MLPDVEAKFYFQNCLNTINGFRPIHKITENCLTTGLHKYYDDKTNSDKMGTITFITPEEYPHSLLIGKDIEMYDGTKLIGKATITKIYNKVLEK